MHLLPRLHLLIKQLFLLLLLCLLLLVTNKILNHGCLGNVLVALMIKELLLLLLLLLGVGDVLLYLFAVGPFVVENFLPLLLLLGFVQQSYLCFLVHFHLVPQLLFALVLHVASPLIDDVTCLLPSLLNLLERTVLLLFKQLNSIGK